MNNRNKAVALLTHYFELALDEALSADGHMEIAEIVDAIILAAVSAAAKEAKK